jgi:hypothetical protein
VAPCSNLGSVGGSSDSRGKPSELDDIDSGWEDDEEDDVEGLDAGWEEPDPPDELTLQGLTPEERHARAERVAARKQRQRAKASEKAERRKARAAAAAAKQKKQRKSAPKPARALPGGAGEGRASRRPQNETQNEERREALSENKTQTKGEHWSRGEDVAKAPAPRARPRQPIATPRRDWQRRAPILVLVVLLVVSGAVALFFAKR